MNCLLQNPTGNTKSRLTPATNSQIRLRNNRPHPNNSGHRKYSRVPASLVSQASKFFGRDPHHKTRQSLDTDEKTYSRIVNNQSVPKLKIHKRVDATTHLPQGPIAQKKDRLSSSPLRSVYLAKITDLFQNSRTKVHLYQSRCRLQRIPISAQEALRFLIPSQPLARKPCTTKLRWLPGQQWHWTRDREGIC